MKEKVVAEEPWYKRYWKRITTIAVAVAGIASFAVVALDLPAKLASVRGYGDAEIKMDEVSIRYLHEVQVCEAVATAPVGSQTSCDGKHTNVVTTIRKYALSYVLRKKYGVVAEACEPETDLAENSEFVESKFDMAKGITAEAHSVDLFLTNYSQKKVGVRVACSGQITATVRLTLPTD